jgi:hypothetical protein
MCSSSLHELRELLRDEGERDLGYLTPAVVNRQGVSTARNFAELRERGIALLQLVLGSDDCQRNRMVFLACNEQEGSAFGVPGVDAILRPGVEVGGSSLEDGRAGTGNRPAEPGMNSSDTGAPFYEVYECADGRFLAVGALERPFWEEFVAKLPVTPETLGDRDDPAQWPDGKRRLAEILRTRTRDEWAAVFDGTDACVSPVLSLDEAPQHPHAQARHAFIEVGGTVQPAPAPRFSATPAAIPQAPPVRGADTAAVLRDWGISAEANAGR